MSESRKALLAARESILDLYGSYPLPDGHGKAAKTRLTLTAIDAALSEPEDRRLSELLRGLGCGKDLEKMDPDWLYKLGQAIAEQAKKAPDASPDPKNRAQPPSIYSAQTKGEVPSVYNEQVKPEFTKGIDKIPALISETIKEIEQNFLGSFNALKGSAVVGMTAAPPVDDMAALIQNEVSVNFTESAFEEAGFAVYVDGSPHWRYHKYADHPSKDAAVRSAVRYAIEKDKK